MTTRADPPKNAISYGQYLRNRIAEPLATCGAPVHDTRPFWQHIPWLNPYRELEHEARQAELEAGL
jgi:hypothetical protein